MTRDTWLKILLRLFGTASLFALPAVFMPASWMAATHRAIGLGQLPQAPITEYLTRSLSLFYFLAGLLFWALSCDLERYRPLIAKMGVAIVAMGALLVAIDLHAGLPGWWTLHEGPQVAVFGALCAWLARRRTASGSAVSGKGD